MVDNIQIASCSLIPCVVALSFMNMYGVYIPIVVKIALKESSRNEGDFNSLKFNIVISVLFIEYGQQVSPSERFLIAALFVTGILYSIEFPEL